MGKKLQIAILAGLAVTAIVALGIVFVLLGSKLNTDKSSIDLPQVTTTPEFKYLEELSVNQKCEHGYYDSVEMRHTLSMKVQNTAQFKLLGCILYINDDEYRMEIINNSEGEPLFLPEGAVVQSQEVSVPKLSFDPATKQNTLFRVKNDSIAERYDYYSVVNIEGNKCKSNELYSGGIYCGITGNVLSGLNSIYDFVCYTKTEAGVAKCDAIIQSLVIKKTSN